MQRLEWHCHSKSVSGALYKAILRHGQCSGKEMANSAVFNLRRNAGRKHSTIKYSYMSNIFREIHTRQCHCTVLNTVVVTVTLRLNAGWALHCCWKVESGCTYNLWADYRQHQWGVDHIRLDENRWSGNDQVLAVDVAGTSRPYRVLYGGRSAHLRLRQTSQGDKCLYC